MLCFMKVSITPNILFLTPHFNATIKQHLHCIVYCYFSQCLGVYSLYHFIPIAVFSLVRKMQYCG